MKCLRGWVLKYQKSEKAEFKLVFGVENLKKLNFNIVFVILSFRRKRPSGLQGVAVAKKISNF